MAAYIDQVIRDHPIVSGWVGAGSSFVAALVSRIDELNAILSSISLILGIVIAILTLPPTAEKCLDWARRKLRNWKR